MASVQNEINRIATAKSDIKEAIELCGVDVPETAKIDEYAALIEDIPPAIFSRLDVDPVGGSGQYIESIQQTNGKISAQAQKLPKNTYIPFIIGTGTTAGTWLGTTDLSSLTDGQTIRYWTNIAGASSTTLNLTLADGKKTGAITIYRYGTTKLTTQYGVNSLITLIYRESINNAPGWWVEGDYDSDSNNYDRVLMPYLSFIAGTNGVKKYSIIMEDSEGKWQSFTTTSGTEAGKTINSSAQFKLSSGCFLYYSSADITSSGTVPTWSIYNIYHLADIRYSTNYVNNTTTGMTAKKMVYLVGTINASGYFVLSNPWYTQTPTDTTKVYLPVGYAYDTYRFIFDNRYKPVCVKGNVLVDYVSGSSVSKSGQTLTVTINGSAQSLTSSSYTLPPATSTQLGGIKVGTGLTISNQVLSISCTAGSGNTDQPVVLTNTSNGLFYTNTFKINYSTGKVTAAGSIYAASFFQNSDINLKHNIQPLQKSLLEQVYNVKEISFNWNSDNTESFGYIAQDYEKISKTFVSKKTDGLLSLNYTEVLVAQIAALKQKIKDLEIRLSNLEN